MSIHQKLADALRQKTAAIQTAAQLKTQRAALIEQRAALIQSGLPDSMPELKSVLAKADREFLKSNGGSLQALTAHKAAQAKAKASAPVATAPAPAKAAIPTPPPGRPAPVSHLETFNKLKGREATAYFRKYEAEILRERRSK